MKRTSMLAASTALVLTVLLFAVFAVQPAQAHPSTFPDVAESDPAHDAIESLTARQIVAGTTAGDFLPGSLLDRGQAVRILVLWRQQGQPSSPSAPLFPDVDAATKPYVDAAVANGWVSGYPNGTFRPHAPITREQIAVVLVRSLGLKEAANALTKAQVDVALEPFADESRISVAARPYMALAVSKNLFSATSGCLYALAGITRAEFCLTLYRAEAVADDSAADAAAAASPSDSSASEQSEYTPEEEALAAFMDDSLFQPHSSPVTGMMVLQNAHWYGIPPLAQLVIMAAETSLGDPDLGGALARRNNFGCLRYHGPSTAWGLLSDGVVWVAGKDWYSFATPQLGMAAWGRYLKTGVNGYYLPILAAQDPDWESFATVYYGRGVSGFGSYVGRLNSIERRFRAMAAEQGVSF